MQLFIINRMRQSELYIRYQLEKERCNELEANVKKALEQLGMDTVIEHVTDFSAIAAYSVMSTPALVIDGKVVSYGMV